MRRYEACGVDQIILSCSAGNNRHEHIMENIELFAREVMPEFVERDERSQMDKARRLEPVIEKVLARKPVADHPAIDPDYVIPAYPRIEADHQEGGKFARWLDEYAGRVAAGEDVGKRLR